MKKLRMMTPIVSKKLKTIRNQFCCLEKLFRDFGSGGRQWKNHQKIKNFHMLTPIEKA